MLEQTKELKTYSIEFEIHDHVVDKVKRDCVISFTAPTLGGALEQFWKDDYVAASHIREFQYLEEYGNYKTHQVEDMMNSEVVRSFDELDVGQIIILVQKG